MKKLMFILFLFLIYRAGAAEAPETVNPDCRDTTIYHSQKVAFLMVVNFNASALRWTTGYRKWSTVEKTGLNCPPARVAEPIKYTFYFSNNKKIVKQDVVDFRVLKQ